MSGAPICRDDEEALRELSSFTDVFLSHNRRINIRCDDSVMDFYRGQPYMVRRSRGYAPLPFLVTGPASVEDGAEAHRSSADENESPAPCVLGIGGELKNTFCFAKGNLYYPIRRPTSGISQTRGAARRLGRRSQGLRGSLRQSRTLLSAIFTRGTARPGSRRSLRKREVFRSLRSSTTMRTFFRVWRKMTSPAP